MKYRMKKDRFIAGVLYAKFGEIVYKYDGYDYGVSSDDAAVTGAGHISVTKNNKGGGFFFTVPTSDLEPMQ